MAPLALTFLGTILLVLVTIVLQGTTLKSLVAGIITRPAHMAALWYLPVKLDQSAVPVAISGLLMAIVYLIFSAWREHERTLRTAVTVGKLMWGAAVLWFPVWLVYHDWEFRRHDHRPILIAFASPFAWLLVAPDLRRDSNPVPRILLATAAVFEVLLIYPVAGSQHAFSTFLFLPAAIVGVADALAGFAPLIAYQMSLLKIGIERSQRAIEVRLTFLRDLRSRKPFALSAIGNAWLSCLLVVVFAISGYPRISFGQQKDTRHIYKRLLVPIYFSGAGRLRMPFSQAGAYHWVVSIVDGNCDSLVTEPFYGSFHLWTGLHPLTGMNVTDWMQLLTPQEQQQIVDGLQIQKHPCVVYNPDATAGTEFWRHFKTQIPEAPLITYIQEHFRAYKSVQDYALLVPITLTHPPDDFLLFRTTYFDSKPGYAIAPDIPVNADGRTFSMWFKTRAPGALFGCQNLDNLTETPTASMPVLYINDDGRLTAQYQGGESRPLVSDLAIDDGVWHQFALIRNGADRLLYVDGLLVGHVPGTVQDPSIKFCEIGDAFSKASRNNKWLRFKGYIARAKLTGRPLTPNEILADYQHERALVIGHS